MNSPHTRMHRLFLILELLALICEHVRNDCSNGGKTLASLARTCKFFHHVATSALWSNLNGLEPLLRSLASDLIGEQDTAILIGSLSNPHIQRPLVTLRRPLKKAEWATFQSRACRVKHLRVNDLLRPVDVSIIRTLCNPPTTSPLFPNLRSILWNDDRPETFPFIRMLSGPTVTSVTINIVKSNTWRATELGILTSLPYTCPNVTHLSLPPNTFVDGVPFISEAICAWGKLAEVHCGTIDSTALAYLSRQPTLHKISFTLPPNSRVWLDYLRSDAFFSVREFDIRAANISLLIPFINKLRGSPTSMRMLVCTSPPPAIISSFFTALGRFQLQDLSLRLMAWQSRPPAMPNAPPAYPFPHWQPPDSMQPVQPQYQYLGVHDAPPHTGHPLSQMGGSHPAPIMPHVLTSREFAPLALFESLGKIDINVDHVISLNDDDLKTLASSWPNLYSFSLNDITGWRTNTGITQIGLLDMIELCPNLQTLCIALKTGAFKEVPADRPGEGIENTSLQMLGLADSAIESRESVAVAAFLSDIFPNLTNIAAWDSVAMMRRPNAAIYVDRWTQVCEMVKGINKVRQQERRWQQMLNDVSEEGET